MNNLKAEKHRLLFQGHSTGYSFRPRPWSWSRRLIFSTFNDSILFTLRIVTFILGLTYLVCIFFELRERFLRTNNSRYENAETMDSDFVVRPTWIDGHLTDWVACPECTDYFEHQNQRQNWLIRRWVTGNFCYNETSIFYMLTIMLYPAHVQWELSHPCSTVGVCLSLILN